MTLWLLIPQTLLFGAAMYWAYRQTQRNKQEQVSSNEMEVLAQANPTGSH